MYAGQEYMTPGAAQTVAIIAEAIRLDDDPLLVEMASGKGYAAASLAAHQACRILCVEPHGPYVRHSADTIRRLGVGNRVRVVQANGRQLPFRANTMTGAYCIGAPSIVGLRAGLAELARVVIPGGWVVVSDVIWREQPGPLDAQWRWVKDAAQTTSDQYIAAIDSAGLRVDRVTVHGRDAWEEYWRPILAVAGDARAAGDESFAADVEQLVTVERRAVDSWLDYTTFVAVKRG